MKATKNTGFRKKGENPIQKRILSSERAATEQTHTGQGKKKITKGEIKGVRHLRVRLGEKHFRNERVRTDTKQRG